MAYEVIKRVGGRAYRYRVESYRDRETGRVRGKWTYVGRVDGEGTLSPDRLARPSSRERLIDAVERLFDRHELAAISSGMVASEAGVAYGTFYRYFKDVGDVVRAAMERRNEVVERLGDALSLPLATHAEERARLECWAAAVVGEALERPGIVRAWYVASNSDAALIEMRRARSAALGTMLQTYVERMVAAGFGQVEDAGAAAFAIVATLEAVIRARTVAGEDTPVEPVVTTIARLAGFGCGSSRSTVPQDAA